MITTLLATVLLSVPSQVVLHQASGHWNMTVDGKPYTIKGAGGNHSWSLLAEVGGNSVRTWGTENIASDLATAQKAGVKVMVGIWLGHKEHGFKYDDRAQVSKQFEQAKAVIEKYKDNPAVLMWGIGNEMEGYDQGDDPKIWMAVEEIAHMAHKVDPNHPTATVVAEIGGKKVGAIHAMCPSLDIVGINSYAGAASVYDRYVKQGGKKPYVITECGPPGAWESENTQWKRPIEQSSTQKEIWYERAYKSNVVDHPDLCLGCFSFLWSNKQETTATWFGMFLPDGIKLGAVDVMQKLWSGKPPKFLCPRLARPIVDGDQAVEPGQVVKAHVVLVDPQGEPMKVRWSLTPDNGVIGVNGDKEDVPDTIADAILASSDNSVTVKMPKAPGMYRLFVVARNQHDGAAVANIPLRVRGTSSVAFGAHVKLPFTFYSGAGSAQPFVPSGWMGSTGNMKIDLASSEEPHTGSKCIRWDYTANEGWGAIAWQSPEGDWGDKPGGYDLSGAKKLSVWARGRKGGEVVSFGVGMIPSTKPYSDTVIVDGGKHPLTDHWQKFEINLSGQNLQRIKTGFVMTIASSGSPVTIYLSDIVFE